MRPLFCAQKTRPKKMSRILVIPWAYGAGMDDAILMRPLFRAFGAWMDERFLVQRDGGEASLEREVAFASPLGMPMQPPGFDALIVSEWIRDDGQHRVPIFTSNYSFCIEDCHEHVLKQFGHIILLKCPSLQSQHVSRDRWQEWETFERRMVMGHSDKVSVFDLDKDVSVSRSVRRASATFHTPPWKLLKA